MLYNNPKNFREDLLKGYVAAYPEYVIEVPGGVARTTEMSKGKITVINGGGSGHYPAFCGIVGEGFMDATVVGNVFTSPSTEDVYNVAKTIHNGNGIFIVGGNYAGDKMNFNLARDRLIEEGIDTRTFYITDDIASASKEEIEKRRGNVGTFFVFKTAGAAAQDGVSFDELVRITKKANDNTRTMSVGFKGCTLPGAQEPMFHVPNGKMEVGQGIHGEPGVYEDDLKSAVEIAELLVSKVLSEKPNGTSNKIAVILDGLGSTKYEELFVVWGTVSELLTNAGYELVYPLVGEYVTSLDMQGIALSIQFLDDELEKYWLYPANTPSFRRGNSEVHHKKLYLNTATQTEKVYEKGSEESIDLANKIVDALKNVKKVIEENEAKLAEIDSIAGDGDHGRGMVKGTSYAYEAAKEALKNGAAAGDVLLEAGKAWAAKAGGTSGVLWGESIQSAAKVIGNHQALSKEVLDNAVKAALDRMVKLGGAHLGDKTMVDVLEPFYISLKDSKATNYKEAWLNACLIADKAAQETKNLLPKVGRARPQALRSLGTPDAGAVSMALVFRALIVENH